MRFKPLLTLAAFALLAAATARAQEQQQPQSDPQSDQQVIDDFVTTRGVSFDEPGKRPQKQAPARQPAAAKKRPPGAGFDEPKQGAQSASTGRPAKTGAQGKGSAGKAATAQKPKRGSGADAGDDAAAAAAQGEGGAGLQTLKASAGGAAASRPVALGYTILMKDGAGRLSVADPARTFRTGDRIAVALETNADGYLYLFNASDGKNPEMLFPNAQLDGGANAVAAHARATFPADPTHDIEFTDPPAAEHLFIIFSREPLAGVPTGAELLRFCGSNVEDCVWKPTAAQWERIRGSARGRGVTEAKNTQLAQAKQPVMPDTLTRGLKVKRDDPKPAIVRVSNSPEVGVLVTEIVLTHK